MLTDSAVLKAFPNPYTVTVLPVVFRCAVRFAPRCRRFQACMMPLLRRASHVFGNRCKGAAVVVRLLSGHSEAAGWLRHCFVISVFSSQGKQFMAPGIVCNAVADTPLPFFRRSSVLIPVRL